MNRIYLFIVTLVFVLSGSSVFAQPDLAYVIVAGKNGSERKYEAGERLFIKYNGSHSIQKARGYFAGVTDGKIAILSKRTSGETALISADSILLLRKIRPGQRVFFAATGIALTGGGAVLLDRASNTSGNSGATILVIPVIGAGVYFLWAIPVSLLVEKLNEKRKSKGWAFSIRKL
ncbi:MAG: hypothetical protein HZA79_08755 [Sphingobacteriales bacterium]|nr:hypothetical protein [Sphingobacteriales bacterium]